MICLGLSTAEKGEPVATLIKDPPPGAAVLPILPNEAFQAKGGAVSLSMAARVFFRNAFPRMGALLPD